jgi:hypothetical protein
VEGKNIMSDDNLMQFDDLQAKFMEEVRGFGSLAVSVISDSADESDEGKFLGYDIRPEDIEALYFEAIGTPRWDSIKADNVDEQLKIYEESMEKIMSDYPFIKRIMDTDVVVEYKSDEVSELQKECERVLKTTDNAKAVWALQKFLLACSKASEGQMGLVLIPN